MDQSQKLSKTIQPERHNMQQQRSELEGRTFLWRMPATERPRSPNRNLKSSRGLSPQRNFNELHQVPSLRAANNSRAKWFLSYDGASRPTVPLTVKYFRASYAAYTNRWHWAKKSSFSGGISRCR